MLHGLNHDCVAITVSPTFLGGFGSAKKDMLNQLGVLQADNTFTEMFSHGDPISLDFITAMRLCMLELDDFP